MRSNDLLSGMPRSDLARMSAIMKPVELIFRQVLYDASAIEHVYFPLDCVVSLLVPLKDHLAVEVGLIGSEGMIGIPLALGVPTSLVRAVVHGPGTALRMNAATFRREFRSNAALREGIQRYIHRLMGQLTQTAACNAFHPIEARFARSLMMTRDRMQSDQLELTHEFIANVLGVRRVGVTLAAGNLQRQGLIAYSRGRIDILDATRLSAAACECYGVLKNLHSNTIAARRH
jgi:CRP-like cAMP-binding protein